MSEFWRSMAPWLLMAVLMPTAILLSLKTMPSPEWCERVIRDWADSEGLEVAEIEDGQWYDFFGGNTSKVYRVRVLDEEGRTAACKAVVGRFLLRPTHRNIAITWIKARGIDE